MLSQDGEARLTRRDGGADPSAANPAAFGMTLSWGRGFSFYENAKAAAGVFQISLTQKTKLYHYLSGPRRVMLRKLGFSPGARR
jgi:hypothetical protein